MTVFHNTKFKTLLFQDCWWILLLSGRRGWLSCNCNNNFNFSEATGKQQNNETTCLSQIHFQNNDPIVATEKKEEMISEDKKSSLKIKSEESESRRTSVNYQLADDDHPDLQSIQNIVANMTFSAD